MSSGDACAVLCLSQVACVGFAYGLNWTDARGACVLNVGGGERVEIYFINYL